MSQSWVAPQNAQSAKAIDFALVIAGWPTVYTAAKSYTLPASGVDSLSTAEGFDSVTKAWASVSDIAGLGAKGRPEEGSCTVSQIDVDLIDRMSGGSRAITDLCSRQAYLDNAATYPRTTLRVEVDHLATEIPVSSTNGFSAGGG